MSRETALVWKERVRTADWLTGSRAWERREEVHQYKPLVKDEGKLQDILNHSEPSWGHNCLTLAACKQLNQ